MLAGAMGGVLAEQIPVQAVFKYINVVLGVSEWHSSRA